MNSGMKELIKKISFILDNGEKKKIVLLFILMIIGGCLEMSGVSLMLPLISYVLTNDGQTKIGFYVLVGLLFLIYIVKNLFLIFMYDRIFRYTSNGSIKLSSRIMDVYLNADYDIHLKKNVSEIIRAIQYDSDAVYLLIKALLQLASEGIMCIILGCFLLYTDTIMSVFLMLLLGAVCGMFLSFSKKESKRLGEEEMNNRSETNRWVLQTFGGIKEIKLLGREQFFQKKVGFYRDKTASNMRKQQLLLQIPRLLVETVCICGVLCIVVYKVYIGENMEVLLPKLGVFAVAAFRLLPSVGKSNGLIGEVLFYKAAVDEIYSELKNLEKFEIQKHDSNETKPFKWEKTINVKNLSFRYDKDTPMILNDCSFEIPYGAAIGLVGPSGSGKTTLVDLIMGMIKPTTGVIEVDGRDIQEDLRAWQKQIGYVPQSIYLSDDTIRANVAFGIKEEEINDEKVWAALKKAQIDTFIKSKPEGLDTQVGDRGIRFSGGQRQRIGIARALYHDPDFLVFDEATSALDNETEEAVMKAIETLHGEKTMIIIAHRLTTIKDCDFVYRVDNGIVKKQENGEVINENCSLS